MSATVQSAQAFQSFLDNELSQALDSFDENNTAVYTFSHLGGPDEPSRRVLVVIDSRTEMIFVSVEAAYQLFDGDNHYHVHQVGAVSQAEAVEKLRPLVEEAYRQIMAWKPSFESIEDNAFLPA